MPAGQQATESRQQRTDNKGKGRNEQTAENRQQTGNRTEQWAADKEHQGSGNKEEEVVGGGQKQQESPRALTTRGLHPKKKWRPPTLPHCI
ncbi:MAG: hypothetical protein K2I86_05470, partial [Prevotella sp.]|nr:hypothetical protein [Prevotella sp.]